MKKKIKYFLISLYEPFKINNNTGVYKTTVPPPPGGGIKKMIFKGDWIKKMIFGVLVRAVFLKKYALFGQNWIFFYYLFIFFYLFLFFCIPQLPPNVVSHTAVTKCCVPLCRD